MSTRSVLSIITSMMLVTWIIFASNLFLASGNVGKAFTKLFSQAPANEVVNTTNSTSSQPLANPVNGTNGSKSSAVTNQLLKSILPKSQPLPFSSQQPNTTLPRQLIISPSQLPNSTLSANITAHMNKQPTATTPPRPKQQTTTLGFNSKGTINSLINTSNASWIVSGSWILNVDKGYVKFFDTNMTWVNNNGMTSHTHELRNFKSVVVTVQQPTNDVFLNGLIDVGTDHRIVWQNVPITISIHGGKTITIFVDDNATNRHFAGQPILGLVNSFTPCSNVPGANMEVLPSCS
ncbi:MAG TPA: hypothetical protein VFI73_01600 [Candidatus Nitrosopolaris sp.]|nr:hypothetical protein [Candidatus Nitrosopolaris sp.]